MFLKKEMAAVFIINYQETNLENCQKAIVVILAEGVMDKP